MTEKLNIIDTKKSKYKKSNNYISEKDLFLIALKYKKIGSTILVYNTG
jgi:hypothetical protein